MRQRRADEADEQGMGAIWPALEFRVCLRPDPVRVVDRLDELDEATVGRRATAEETVLFET
jgi:hypothetical protein